MNDPQMMAQLMAAQQAEQAQGPSDEDMLAQVQRGMGNEGGPPPGSGMKWQNLEEDQAALEADPSPENVQAFVQYWGEDKLPQGIAPGGPPEGGPPEAAEGEY